MRILETFQQFSKRSGYLITEESSGNTGFVAVIGSTDTANLLSGSADPIGIKQDTTITLKISGVNEMLKIGAAKKFENATLGKKVSAGLDYLIVKSGDKKYEIKEKGSINLPFNPQTVLEIEGSGNGLLALLRALHYLNVAVTKNNFDPNSPFDGIMMIKIGEVTRKGMGLSVNAKYEGDNTARVTLGYKEIVQQYIPEALDADEKPKEIQSSSFDQILVTADSIADAIKAAHFLKQGKKWNSKFSSFLGFNDMQSAIANQPADYYLSVSFQYCIAGLSDFYPMDLSKVWNVDLQPYAKKIVDAQPADPKLFEGNSIKSQISTMLKIYQPKTLKDYPEFDEFLPKYWETLINAIVNRIISQMPKTYDSAMANVGGGKEVKTSGGVGTGQISHGSGRVDN